MCAKRFKEKFDDILYEILPHFLYRFYHWVIDLEAWGERIKRFIQRRTIGWDDSETWSLDDTFYNWLLPRLKRFQHLHCGYPSCYESFEKWDNELKERIHQLELIVKYHYDSGKFPELKYLTEDFIKANEIDEETLKTENAKALWSFTACLKDFNEWFGKNVNNLWW